MITDEELNKKLDEAIKKEAQREVNKSRAIKYYFLGFITSRVIILVRQVLLG